MSENVKPNAAMEDRTSIDEGIAPPSEGYDYSDLDALADEMNQQTIPDDFDRAYSFDQSEPEEEQEVQEEEEAIEPVDVEGQESTEPEVESTEEAPEGEVEPESENFYDAERDFPGEKVAPTVYKDRISLDSGVAAKVNYAREQLEKLESMGANLGAIDLPELFEGNEEFVKNPFDREAFLEVDDDTAKKAAFEMDKFINAVKGKVSRIETEFNASQEVNQITEQYNTALDELVVALELGKIPLNEATQLTQAQIEQRIEEEIVNYKENVFDDVYTRKGLDEANEGLRKLNEALNTVRAFPEIAQKYNEVANKKSSQVEEVTREQMKSSFEELQKDRPDLEMFKAETDLLQRDFLEYVRLKIEKGSVEKPGTPRAWLNLYNQHQKDRMEAAKKLEARRKQNAPAQPKPKQKPPVSRVRNMDYSNARSSIDDVDAEMEELAKELNQIT